MCIGDQPAVQFQGAGVLIEECVQVISQSCKVGCWWFEGRGMYVWGENSKPLVSFLSALP